ncbi:PhoD-like phosphatase-domain-containing protein [Mycena rosella]|uniref:PhoD-like phosphatase-domain-containing protein n=1 Tax=Mycena rosella TaxID=1033263 RepID=A0AAD7E0U1_MYCRO|nr:PhoD-like phosphatase-domain-containing protein [Mycena rosella]
MDFLYLLEAGSSTLFRLVAFLFLRIIPSPLAQAALPALYIAYLTAAFLAPKTPQTESETDTSEDAFRTLVFSLPARSPRLRRANALINGLLVLMVAEFVATPFLDTAADLSFSRIGAVSSDSVKISVRFPEPNATAHLLWREHTDADPPNPWRNGPALAFTPEQDYVFTVKLAGLWPNTSYEYALADVNRSLTSGPFAFHTFPDSRLATGSHFRFVASSCITPNFPYVPLHGRTITGFDLLARYLFPESAPADAAPGGVDTPPAAAFLLFLGDFIYSDVPAYIGDTKEAYRRLYRRNYQSKSFKKIYERLPVLHTYDDHEIKNNFAGLGNDSTPPFPSASDAFKIYNADANYDSLHDHHYYNFRYGDAAFFVLDTRRYRTPATEDVPAATMLGETQLAALYSWLGHANGTASFKFIVSSVPFTSLWGHDAAVDSWAAFPAEKAALLDALHSVPNVVIISGDRHEFASIEFNTPHMHTVREYSTSPLSMFDIPFYRTLRMQSDETVPQNLSELVMTEDGPTYVNSTEEVPKERVVKYLARGNSKWSAFEMDTRDLSRPTLRIELVIDGKIRYREELVGSPVKLQASNALGVFVTTGIKDVFNRIGIKPSRWF